MALVRGTTAALLAVLIGPAMALAGCLGAADTAEPPASAAPAPTAQAAAHGPVTVLEDPAGDAFAYNAQFAASSVPCVFVPGAPFDPAYCSVTWTAAGMAGTAGAVPAAPARDLLAVRVAETPATVEVEMDVASLSEDLVGAHDPESREGTYYFVQFGDDRCWGALGTIFWPMPDAVEEASQLFWYCAPDEDGAYSQGLCSSPTCAWAVPASVTYGAPATLRWSVPRMLLSGTSSADAFDIRYAASMRIGPLDESSPELIVRGPAELWWYRALGNQWYAFDSAGPAEPFPFTMRAAPEVPLPVAPIVLADDDLLAAEPASRPDLRIRAMTFDERPDRFRFTFGLDAVDDVPLDHSLAFEINIPGHAAWGGYDAADGERQTWANLVLPDWTFVSLPIAMRVEPGQPGRVVFELLRNDLPPIPAGATAGLLLGYTYNWYWEEASLGAASVTRAAWTPRDFVGFAAPFAFADSSGEDADLRMRWNDPQGDARPPPDVVLTSGGRFDLQSLELGSSVPGEVRVTLGVGDLSELDPPRGYDDVFYAVGIEHQNGATMVGYYRGDDKPTGEFVCAPDVTVLGATHDDPVRAPDWSPIVGHVLVAAANNNLNQGTTSVGSAAFIITAPTECFGLGPDATTLNVTALRAGSYLVRRTAEEVPGSSPAFEVDALEVERTAPLALAQAPVEVPSWWSEPFGVSNFWDMLGAAIAALTVLVTVGIFLDRRRRMKWYLHELARIEASYLREPPARASALVALRRQLHHDIVRHRVSDPHYILDRLRTSITSARLVSIGDGYYGLPAPLALRIERLLDDGRLTAEEASLLEPLIAKSRIAGPARDLLAERLRAWVEEDAFFGRPAKA